MKKDKAPQVDVWNDTAPADEQVYAAHAPEILEDLPVETDVVSVNDLKPPKLEYSLEGLKEDFPKANDLEKFVLTQSYSPEHLECS